MEFEFLHPNAWPLQACLLNHPPKAADEYDGRYLIHNIIVGRTPEGRTATLSVSLRHHTATPQGIPAARDTVYHARVENYDTATFTGALWTGRDATDSVMVGQIVDAIRAAATHEPVTEALGAAVNALCDLWDRWHNNHLHPGCVHQAPDQGWDITTKLSETPVCPETGYEWGSDWLVEPIPTEVMRALFEHVHTINEEWARVAQPAATGRI
jgi:hypothetical protein